MELEPRADRPGPWRLRPLTTLFLAALAVRLLALALLPLHAPDPDAARGAAWAWGGESSSLAAALYEGRGFSDPWGRGTGPTAWLTPPYPALIAGLLHLFGGLGAAVAVALFCVQSVVSAATCVLVGRLGAVLGRARAGLAAGWLFAFYPPAVWHAAHTVWDTTLVAFAVTWALLALARLPVKPRARSVAMAGLVFGSLVFLNPAPLALLPAALVFMLMKSPRRWHALRNAWVFCVAILGVCTPWLLRNRVVIGAPTLRPNFGVELMIGNHDEAHGHPVPFRYHPSHVDAELERYREQGEVAYSAECGRRARAWIRAHPADFAALSLRRARLFWFGDPPGADPRTSGGRGTGGDPMSWIKFGSHALLGLLGLLGVLAARMRRDTRVLFVGALLLFELPYVLTHVSERYRFPLDPLLALLAVLFVARFFRGLDPQEPTAVEV